MKTTFIQPVRRALFLSTLVAGSFLLSNCSSDDDAPEPEPTAPDFEEVADLPPVEDEDPQITEPETGSIEASEETENIVTDVLNAGDTGSISDATKESLREVGEFSQQLPASVQEKAANLDEAAIDAILNQDEELDADLAAVRDQLEDLPEEISKLLPEINFTADLEALKAMGTKTSGNKTNDFGDLDPVSQVTGSCGELTRAAYDDKIADLTAQMETNLSTIEANYTRRLGEADARYDDRLETQEEHYATNKSDIKATLTDILAAAEKATSIGETALATQLKQLTLLYALDARAALEEWNVLVLELLDNRMEAEKATALEIKETKEDQVAADFETSKDQADEILNEGLANCHNQGSGN
ncbi:hypothetical protein GCM10007103_29080 [Salinimicrobium marinum]|uniref:Uncharacterized protein n=1 Tax=Salinimicrobium marinum TaxID=680283 RepID=A0A918SJM0_9FLAO|nr:hypothetical protein [Salinimicrobium marinum]GHA46171.1 hypothetical protein GCM10007103_29080 [Salinimicrobium marinum]